MKLIMIDNYDSFTYNLVQLFYEFDIDVRVFRHDEVSIQQIQRLEPDWICLSPGPKDPSHSGICKQVVQTFQGVVPMLGVCLGMQVINEVYGGRTTQAPVPVHGKRSRITHDGGGLFRDLPSPFQVARYHSLQVIVQSEQLIVDAHAEDGVIMGVRHRHLPLFGIQFHPESFMSEHGLQLAANFLLTAEREHSVPLHALDAVEPFPRWTVAPRPSKTPVGVPS